jgi:hypothetical protein
MTEPKSPFPPRPTLNDLLTACDVAEEGGAPSEVVRVLRNAARNHMTLSEIIATNVAVHTENTQLREELERLSHGRTETDRDAPTEATGPHDRDGGRVRL